jgi:hypothetical protein
MGFALQPKRPTVTVTDYCVSTPHADILILAAGKFL